MKCVIFTVLLIIAVALAAPQREKRDTCSPMYELCHQTSDCCRHLICASYMAKCVAKGGLIIPGQDKRPLGPGPYPPNVPESELNE